VLGKTPVAGEPRARLLRNRPRFIRPDEEAVTAASLLAPARVPIAEVDLREKGVNVFSCPVCGRLFRYDDEYEPMCTGPGATDDHEMTVMAFVGVEAPRRLIELARARPP